MGNVSWILFQKGRSSNLRLRRGVGQAAHTLVIIPTSSVLEFIVHKQWIMLLQVNCMEFYSHDGGSLHYHTHWSFTFIQSCPSPFETICRLQLEHKAAGDPTHCSHHKHLARPRLNQNKQKESIFLPCLVCLSLRLLMSYVYGTPILDVSRLHTTTHHSR